MPTPIFSAVTPWLTTWLTSLWLIGVGALLGILALLLIWGLTFIVNREAAKQVPLAITEGVLLPITSIVAIVAIFASDPSDQCRISNPSNSPVLSDSWISQP